LLVLKAEISFQLKWETMNDLCPEERRLGSRVYKHSKAATAAGARALGVHVWFAERGSGNNKSQTAQEKAALGPQ